ncbi:glycosyltransferase [uncultured Paracoccus sp.]|uniref:glycosyltransferase n=1 Tax=uncultured Paracoccus sp. TaxID=189685 RepID=UPI00262A5DCE|nr:glycosyltransferase [uncultured Paracoccus sp.]
MPPILINASNLHVGGGVQVATSFLAEIATKSAEMSDVEIMVSSEVESNLLRMGVRSANKFAIQRRDVRGFALFDWTLKREMDGFQTVFTVFGPLYRWNTKFRSIVGFAQAWIIYPDNECYSRMRRFERLKTRLKFWIQAQFFKRADLLIVELEHVRQGLIRELGMPADRIVVIHNSLSELYRQPKLWEPVPIQSVDRKYLRLGFLGSNYLHKNTVIFPDIADVLLRRYGIDSLFFVTFTDAEWEDCTSEFRAVSVNVGPLSVTQCPPFYKGLDGVVFPSLLESFSVTPLEAMAMEVPLFASDRPFNREICGPHAHYFDPLSAEDAAARIAEVLGPVACFRNALPDAEAMAETRCGGVEADLSNRLRAAREHALSFSSAAERANRYLALVLGEQGTPNKSRADG